jgi:hypothetical protein
MTVIISTVLLMTYRKGKKSLLFCGVNGAAFFLRGGFWVLPWPKNNSHWRLEV